MAAIGKAEINASDVLKDITVSVTVTGVQKARFRLWLATRLIVLATWIAAMNIEITTED